MTVVRLSRPICELGESARWDAVAQRLVWVDLLRGLVHQVAWRGQAFGEVRSQHVGEIAAFAGPATGGEMVLAMGRTVVWAHEVNEGQVTEVPVASGHRLNDGAIDARGRLVAGTMPQGGELGLGQLWSLSPGEVPRILHENLNLPNGIAFSRDGDRLYLVDSVPGLLLEFEYDLESGNLGQRLSAWTMAEGSALPDGMCRDQSGGLWIAMWDGSSVVRFEPRVGKVTDRVIVPATRPTSVALTDDERTLFVTSAYYGLDLPHPEHDGATYAIRLSEGL